MQYLQSMECNNGLTMSLWQSAHLRGTARTFQQMSRSMYMQYYDLLFQPPMGPRLQKVPPVRQTTCSFGIPTHTTLPTP